jgi:hypothetical protein
MKPRVLFMRFRLPGFSIDYDSKYHHAIWR